ATPGRPAPHRGVRTGASTGQLQTPPAPGGARPGALLQRGGQARPPGRGAARRRGGGRRGRGRGRARGGHARGQEGRPGAAALPRRLRGRAAERPGRTSAQLEHGDRLSGSSSLDRAGGTAYYGRSPEAVKRVTLP